MIITKEPVLNLRERPLNHCFSTFKLPATTKNSL